MKKSILGILCGCFVLVFLSGCVHVHINKEKPDVDALIAQNALTADPLEFNADGVYSAVFHYGEGSLPEKDLGTAYVAYYPRGLADQIEQITEDEAGSSEIPPLPAIAQEELDKAEGTNQLERIAVITWELVDDSTVKVNFKDPEHQAKDNTYYYVIPDAGLAGTVTAEKS